MTDDITTISLQPETKEMLDDCKLDGETYEEAVRRLVTDNGTLWTEQDVREIAAVEARNVLQEARR